MSESRNWFILALVVGIGWLFYLLAPVITPFVISAGLAFLGDPLVDRLERLKFFKWHINRTFAVIIVFILISAGLFLSLFFLVPLLREQVERLVENAPEMFDWTVGTALPWLQAKLGLSAFELDAQSLTEALKAYWKEVSTALLGVLGTVSRGGQAVLHWLMNLVLVPVVTFYLLRDWDKLIEGIRTLIPRQVEPVVSDLCRQIEDVLGAFIRGQLMVMIALGLIYFVGLWAVGLDLALIIGMGAGLLSIVPYLGTFVGVVAAVAAAVFQLHCAGARRVRGGAVTRGHGVDAKTGGRPGWSASRGGDFCGTGGRPVIWFSRYPAGPAGRLGPECAGGLPAPEVSRE